MPIPFWPWESWGSLDRKEQKIWKQSLLPEATFLNVKETIEKVWLEKPIILDNIEVWENVPREVVEHILKHNFEVQNPKFIKCVDWRTPEDLIKGIYMPWWTDWLLDLVLNLLSQYNIDVNPKDIRDILVDVIGGEENYYYHSDEHSYDKTWACWCGHDNLVLNSDKHICDLAPKYADFIKEQRKLNKNKMEVLKWEHEEQGVLLFDIEWVSVVPKWEKSSFFVYNQKEVQKILREFISKLNENLPFYLDINRALEELDKEVLSTFSILGNEAPHYRVNLVDWKFRIEFDWKVSDVVTNYYLWE